MLHNIRSIVTISVLLTVTNSCHCAQEQKGSPTIATPNDFGSYTNSRYPTGSVPDGLVEHVIHISMDGLRPDYMADPSRELPNFIKLRSQGTCTLNARHDMRSSQTLPNHIGMFTGLNIDDHGYEADKDNNSTLTDANGNYLENIFDLVKANGGSTAFYGSKDKFEIFNRSWNIDKFVFALRGKLLMPLFLEEMDSEAPFTYAFLHIRNPDREGHAKKGADSFAYREAVKEVDTYLGQIFDMIDNNPELRGKTAIIASADHGFADEGNHADEALLENYRIPFCAFGPGVMGGADLVELNDAEHGGLIVDPKESRGDVGDMIIILTLQ